MCIAPELAMFLAPVGRHVYRKTHPYNSKPQILGGLSVSLGKSDPDPNGDGIVNVLDLVFVAQQFSQYNKPFLPSSFLKF